MEGMRAVFHVMRNRVANNGRNGWPNDIERVCLQPVQFSCWNSKDPQRSLYPAETDRQYLIAQQIIREPGEDPTHGATAYYDRSIPAPSWATPQNLTCQIGRLRFHKL